MALYHKHSDSTREITEITYTKEGTKKPVTAIYKIINGVAVTVWEFIKSCFGKGFWVGDQPWSGTDGWKSI